MRLKSKVGPKGQAVIPKEVREVLGISPGDEVIFEVTGNEAKIGPLRRRSGVDELTEIVRKREKLTENVDIKKIIMSETMGG